jgi:hypothetical protein
LRRPFAVLTASLGVLAITCKGDGGTGTAVPTTVTVSPGVVTLSALGDTQLTATVRDQNNNVMVGQGVAWTSSSPGVATVSPGGLVAAVASGTATIRAAAGAVQGTASVTVSLSSIAVFAGNNQVGLAGFPVNLRPAVIVRDAANAPRAGVAVTFLVTGGGGTATGTSVVSGADGVARIGNWTVQVGANTLTATAAGVTGSPLTFSATGVQPLFNIDVRFATPPSVEVQAAFDSAAARWERLLYGDLQNTPIVAADLPQTCGGVQTPALNETIDDLVILVSIEAIDGPGRVLGSAGPCLVRDGDSLPLLGGMRFDSADVPTFVGNGLFDEIVMHEMGHVIGFGTLWRLKALLVGAVRDGGTDPHFVGSLAIAAFDENGGAFYALGAKVPVENIGGAGTADGHWRESVFDTELMTGFLDAGTNALSVITGASMADLGYVLVNNAGAEPYSVANPLSVRAEPGVQFALVDDIDRGPVLMIDARGRVVRTVRIP